MSHYLNTHKILINLFVFFSLILFFNACSDSDSTSNSTSNSQSYNGPGSKWDVTLNGDDTFAITMRAQVNSPVLLTVNGTYERLTSGFLRFTVTDAEGQDAPSAGDAAWALEVPGYALLLRPIDDNGDQILPMVRAGECPTTDINANWVIVKKDSAAMADDADRDFFGQFNFDVSAGNATLPSRRALANNFQDGGEESISGGTCANGLMNIVDTVMYLTSNGGAIVHTNINNPDDGSFIFALAQKAISNITNLDGNYAGMLFDDNSSSGDKIEPVSMSCTGGTCVGTIVTDITTGAVSAETVTLNLTGTPDLLGAGLVTGTITNGTSGNLACMADINVLDSGRKIVSCVGQSPGDNSKMFNVLFVSNDS